MKNIIYGTGPLGYWVMKTLADKGESVTFVNRSGNTDHILPNSVDIVAGDANNSEEVYQICKDAKAVYFCAMPPYTDWPDNFPPLIKGLIEGISRTEAKLIFGDNLYMYGSTNGEPIREDMPYATSGHKGKTRALVANMLLDAHKEEKIKATMGRASDFYGPEVINAALGAMFFEPALSGKPVNLIGNISQPHTFTYIKDFAKALVILGESEEAFGKAWHVPSAETISTKELVQIIEDKMGKKIKVRVAGKFLISMLGLFNPMVREVKEMMYTWEEPYIVDHSQFEKVFSSVITPHEKAIEETIDWFKNEYKKHN